MQRKMDEAEEGNHRSILQQKLDDMTEVITQVISSRNTGYFG